MKYRAKTLLLSLLIISMLWNCGKDSPSTPIIPQPNCLIQSETYGLVGNEKSFAYEYSLHNDKEELVKVNVLRPNGSISGTYSIDGPFVIFDYKYGSYDMRNQLEYSNPLTNGLLPANTFSTIVDGSTNTTLVDYEDILFGYNAKGELTEVKTRNGASKKGGFEYDITINYNDQGNVTTIKYVYFTGPNEAIPIITVTGHDDHPNPHAGVVGWKFFFINFSFSPGDPGNLIAALSKNNPLGYTQGTGDSFFERKIEYDYTPEGYPSVQRNTNKNAKGDEYTFSQSFNYLCK